MNIWDSVHRGLEKASHEAGRIARAQKLRSQIDGLSRQLGAQQNILINRTMELYNNNQLNQSQLLPLCNEMASLQQQLEQAQNELKQLHSQGLQQTPQTPLPPTNATGTYQVASPYSGSELPPTIAAPPPPPDYPTYPEQGMSATSPYTGNNPQTVSAMETLLMGATPTPPPPPTTPGMIRCTGCQGEIANGLAYCPNCGKPVQESGFAHLPTMRGGTLEPFYPAGQETIRGTADSGERATGPGISLPDHAADQQTVRSDPPSSAQQPNDSIGGP